MNWWRSPWVQGSLVVWVALCCAGMWFAPLPPEPPDTTPEEEAVRQRMADWAVRDAEQWHDTYGDVVIDWDDADGHLAIVIDDVGRELRLQDRLLAIPLRLTFSVLPDSVYAPGAQQRLKADSRRPREIWLHMPMEPEREEMMHEGPEASEQFLTREDDAEAIRRKLERALGKVDAVGVNNHMGSALTRDEDAMQTVMEILAEHDKLFLDSRTHADTVALGQARAAGLISGERQVFLDHDSSPEAVRDALADAAMRSRREPIVVIGHPNRAVVEALEEGADRLREQGIGVYPLSELLARSQR